MNGTHAWFLRTVPDAIVTNLIPIDSPSTGVRKTRTVYGEPGTCGIAAEPAGRNQCSNRGYECIDAEAGFTIEPAARIFSETGTESRVIPALFEDFVKITSGRIFRIVRFVCPLLTEGHFSITKAYRLGVCGMHDHRFEPLAKR